MTHPENLKPENAEQDAYRGQDEQKVFDIRVGRGAVSSPGNRFENTHFYESESQDEEEKSNKVATVYLDDRSESIVSENQSPDLGFRYSVNPYRGCAHGCSYCYARPTHEYLGMNCGLDFETKILVKKNAPELLRKWLSRKSWSCEPIMFSGVTDPYQPAEKEFELTRKCLQVAWEFKQPVMLITKNALITRDVELLSDLARENLVRVTLSITSLDQSLIRVMEPRTSSPRARLDAIKKLAKVGIPVSVNVAPMIPGLNDSEMAHILKSAADKGATQSNYIVLRMPYAVKEIFLDWVDAHFPDKRSTIENRIRSTSNDQLNRGEFGIRMRGTGVYADQIRNAFRVFKKKFGLDKSLPKLDTTRFRRPPENGQLELFS